MAKDYIIGHPEACKYLLHRGTGIPKGGAKKHEHGSVRCNSHLFFAIVAEPIVACATASLIRWDVTPRSA
jgi:hypothetical protein